MNLLRCMMYDFEENLDFALTCSLMGGGVGSLMWLNDPLRGFCLFAWGILILYFSYLFYIHYLNSSH